VDFFFQEGSESSFEALIRNGSSCFLTIIRDPVITTTGYIFELWIRNYAKYIYSFFIDDKKNVTAEERFDRDPVKKIIGIRIQFVWVRNYAINVV